MTHHILEDDYNVFRRFMGAINALCNVRHRLLDGSSADSGPGTIQI